MHLKNYYIIVLLASLGAFAHGSVEIEASPPVNKIELSPGLKITFTAKVSIDPAIDEETQTQKGTYEWKIYAAGGTFDPAGASDGTKFLPVNPNIISVFPKTSGWAAVGLTVSYMTKQGGMKTESGNKSVEITSS